jgi:choline-glycine betaine transporter
MKGKKMEVIRKKVRKMRKAKVITALSLTVVMLAAMTGLVSANGADIRFAGKITDADGNPYVGHIVEIKNSGGSSIGTDTTYGEGWYMIPPGGPLGPTYTAVSNKDDTYTMYIDGKPVNTKKLIGSPPWVEEYPYYYYGWSYRWDYQIPEFATLAIPMGIAILTGLFFLNHRKRREE